MFQIKHLSYSYKLKSENSSLILNDLNFELPNKGLVFITGKSGCGKTTLLNILEGLIKPTSGEVFYNGINIYKDKKIDFNSEIGILFQNYNLLDNLTVYQNLKIVTDLTNLDSKIIDDKLKEFNLLEFKNQDISNLSGGEKQRIAFIRATLSNPKVLFADEPTGAIDEENASYLMAKLRELSKEILVVVVTHNTSLIEDSDHAITLNNGIILNTNLVCKDEKPLLACKTIKKRKKSYKRILSKRLFKKSSFKHLLFIISLFFTSLFSFLTLDTTMRLKSLKGNLEFSYENYNEFLISYREKRVETNSPITLIKEVRPDLNLVKEKLERFKDVEIFNNYSYFLNGKNHLYSDKTEIKNVKIALSYNLKSGAKINNSLFDLLNHQKPRLSLELNQNYTYNLNSNESYTENFIYLLSIREYDVIDEFKYLNVPTIYLPLFEFETYLKETYLNKTFVEGGTKVNWFDVISNAKKDDPISSYSYAFYFDDKDQTKECFKFLDTLKVEDDLKITSDPYIYVKSFLDIAHILSIGLIVFSSISLLITLLLLFFITYSIYLEQKKDFSILRVLGLRWKDINSIFSNVLGLETLTTSIFSLSIEMLSLTFLNRLIQPRLGIKNFYIDVNNLTTVSNNYFASPYINKILLLFVSVVLCEFVGLFAKISFKKIKIGIILREE